MRRTTLAATLALLVAVNLEAGNQRGQKFTDRTMDELAGQVAKGHAKPMEEQKGTAIDRAWTNVLDALRSFAVPEEGAAT